MTLILNGTDNSATTPAVTGTDTDTGVYYPAANQVALATAGTLALIVDSSQNVGIGTSTPSAKGQVNATNFALANSYNTLTSNFAVRTTNAQAANVGGEIALGGFNNDGASQISDFVRLHGKKTNSTSTNVSGYFAVEVASDGGPAPYMFERMRILDTGPVLMGTTVAGEGYGNNNSGITIRSTGAASVFSNFSSDYGLVLNKTTYQSGSTCYQINFRTLNTNVGGIFTDNSSTTYATTSDYRLKESVTPMVDALSKVALLKPVNYKWKRDGSDGQGFIAHELAEVCPQAVVGTKDQMREEPYEITPAVKDELGNVVTEAVMGTRTIPDYQSIDTSFLVATLTAAIQEMKAIIDNQAERITALEAK
jgi:hypothetical protein